ncbi:hypothetical protein V8F20_010186 [Naviculisporaceae sp. PSN 640]
MLQDAVPVDPKAVRGSETFDLTGQYVFPSTAILMSIFLWPPTWRFLNKWLSHHSKLSPTEGRWHRYGVTVISFWMCECVIVCKCYSCLVSQTWFAQYYALFRCKCILRRDQAENPRVCSSFHDVYALPRQPQARPLCFFLFSFFPGGRCSLSSYDYPLSNSLQTNVHSGLYHAEAGKHTLVTRHVKDRMMTTASPCTVLCLIFQHRRKLC